jgi:leucine dehydrogenase
MTATSTPAREVSSVESAEDLLDVMAADGYEQVVHCHDRGTGLRSIIAIHDTTLGPALGGVRMWPYDSGHSALVDCLRLARGMTYKAAAAGVNLGGGKSVIMGDPRRDKSEALMRAHGRFIQTLGGRYIPGIDVGTDQADLEAIAVEAEHVSCVRGDPSPMTALGVFEGMRAALGAARGSNELAGIHVCVQGAGQAQSARLTIADVDAAKARGLADRLGAEVVAAADAVATPCDVFAPCAMGAVVNDVTLPGLRCSVVAGAANNVLQAPEHGETLHERGILYAPDFCINAGGLIFLEEEMLGHDAERTERRVRRVGALVRDVIARAERDGTSTARAADALARDRLASLRDVGPATVGSVRGARSARSAR